MKTAQNKLQKGFTLIELLVVIAILGVLATVVLAAIDPLGQLARGRDASRVSIVTQLGHATSNYGAANSSTFPATATTFQTTLKSAGEITQTFTDANSLANTSALSACKTPGNTENGYCYTTITNGALVYVTAESSSYVNKYKVGNGGTACSKTVVFMYDTTLGKTVLTCVDPTAAAAPTGSTTTIGGVTFAPVSL